MEKENVFLWGRRKNGEGKEEKYLETKKFFEGGKQNGGGKGGKYLEEKNIWSLEEKKTKKEKEETIWRKKVFCGEKQKGKIFLEGETVADL